VNAAPNWKPAPALRSEPYLAWVRTLASVQSGKRSCIAHHPVGHGRLSSLKVSDFYAIPLTDAEHKILHDGGWDSWERDNGLQYDHAATVLKQAIACGVLAWKPDANLCHWADTAQEIERAIREGELIFNKRAARYAA